MYAMHAHTKGLARKSADANPRNDKYPGIKRTETAVMCVAGVPTSSPATKNGSTQKMVEVVGSQLDFLASRICARSIVAGIPPHG